MSATAEKPMELAVIVKGEIVQSNFEDFAKTIDEQLAKINTDLVTDADFGQAELDVKGLKLVERAITDARANVLAQMEGPNKLLMALEGKGEDVRSYRLGMERDIKAKKIEVKKSIVTEALDLISHDNPAKYQAQIEEAMKGKRNFDSLREAADGCANAISKRLERNHEVIAEFVKSNGSSIAPDVSRLEDMELDALREQLTRRAELAAAEAEKKRLDDERRKAEAELAELKAKESAAPAKPEPLPEPPKVGAIPVKNTPEPETAAEEMKRYIAMVEECFAPARAARENLKHPENIEAAQVFAKTLGKAWSTLKCAQQ